ncbi:MAG: MYG1 family protein [Candidatus Paceibacterota bacterium]
MTHKPITVVTHNGGFHADDIFGTAVLLLAFKREGIPRDAIHIVRTRDVSVIEKGDYVLDVGGEYDPKRKRFDHHQVGGAGKRENGISYASFGLLWKEYGTILCGSEEVANRIDEKLVAPTDADDNGDDIFTSVYSGVAPYTISSYVASKVPTWKEVEDSEDDVFLELLSFAESLIEREISVGKDRSEGNRIAEDAYTSASDKRLLVLDQFIPWKRVAEKYKDILFVVLPDRNPLNGWHVYTVRKNDTGFENRKNLPEAWGGLRDTEMAEVTGVSDAFFCHNKLFIAATKTKEGALALAQLALDA